MNDKYKIDSHKLIYHPRRVADWYEAQLNNDFEKLLKVYPIYVEISPVGFCNHRCVFCALDFMEYQYRKIEPNALINCISDMANCGIKSIMFAGEGEPTLYKELPEIIEHCFKVNIDTSLTTNIIPFNEHNANIYVKYCKWIKVSINGGNPKTYALIHNASEKDYYRAIDNMKLCAEIKKKNNYNCTLGAQLLLIPENADSVIELTKTIFEIGFDYIVIKPYSQHPQSYTNKYKDIDYTRYLYLYDELKKYNNDKFNVIFRIHTIKKLFEDIENRYKKCYSVPFFWAYIMSDGSVYSCSMFLNNDKFNLGNVHTQNFHDIWESQKRLENIKYVQNELCIKNCRINCRMDEINRYLWELVNPSPHVNFI